MDLVRLMLPMPKDKESHVAEALPYLDDEEMNKLKYLLKTHKVDVRYSKLGVSTKLMEDVFYPQLFPRLKEEEIKEFSARCNRRISSKVWQGAMDRFSRVAPGKILEYIAPNIYGLEHVKKAAMLQLFCPENVHILLLGDPGTGKTQIIKSASKLHPKSLFGLGSGISGAGLGLTVRGDEVVEGLLPKADGGLCCIDELNLLKKTDYAYLYSAMEDGYVAYNKANKQVKLDARVRVLATANPKGDKFVGRMLDTLRQQLPFEQALLSRFHLIFIIRRLDTQGFVHVAKKIISKEDIKIADEDISFIKTYVEKCEKIPVAFPKEYEKKVLSFVERIRDEENSYLFEVTPRNVVGLVRLCKAHARVSMREKVNDDDIRAVANLMEESLKIRDK
jgi:DNA replicative helicase MCM subunit Mcm2 (Cdc46/Mcm family)